MTKSEAKKLEKDVRDLFNQVAILLKDVELEHEDEWDSDLEQYVENPNAYPENRYLYTLKHIAEEIAKCGQNSEVMEYYSSYCW